jgi:alpha-glucoside transport system substrate-binding protein
MRQRLLAVCALALAVGVAALTAATTAPAAVSGTLAIVGPWKGADEQSFRAVMAGFRQQNPGVTITYTAAAPDLSVLESAARAGTSPDVAVLSLPAELSEMRVMARSGVLEPIEFAVPAVKANYAFSWKALGSVDGKLTALFFKATNDSAFWYDQRSFQSRGVTAPKSWSALRRAGDALLARGIKPYAVSGQSAIALPNLFQNVYLTLFGNRRYDMLARGQIRWSDPSVRTSLRLMRDAVANPLKIAGGLASLGSDYGAAVQQVFGNPPRAAMVPGGSTVIPVLQTAKAARPITQFGVFPFPTTDGKGPARVIGEPNAAVMLNDNAVARAFISYLATPEAATIWAKRGGAFLSPNRKVDVKSYPTTAARTLASALANANVFRFGIADLAPPSFKQTFNRMLIEFLRSPARLDQITARLDAATPEAA